MNLPIVGRLLAEGIGEGRSQKRLVGMCADLSLVALFFSVAFGSSTLALIGAALAVLLVRTGYGLGPHVALATSFATVRALGGADALVDPALASVAAAGHVAVHPALVWQPAALALLFLGMFVRRRAFAPFMVVAALAVAIVGALQWMARGKPELSAVGFLLFWGALAQLAVAGWGLWRERGSTASRTAGLVLITASFCGLLTSDFRLTQGSERRVTIWWPDAPLPEFGSTQDDVGWANIGQYGELPKLLRRAGYQVTTMESLDAVSDPIIVLPVPFRYLNASETAQVRQQVSKGANLLLIGEHSNLDGVQEAFNKILAGTGVALNFDTTNGLFGDGTFSLSGPFADDNPFLTHNRGASLRVSSVRAQVLLRGSWWHSDAGDRLAPEKAFLSDYRLSGGDRVGNLVLAARVPVGQGSVVVWGDSSPFLNQNLVYNSRFELTLFEALAARPASPWPTFVIGLAVMVGGLFLWTWLRLHEIPWLLVVFLVLWHPSHAVPASLPHPFAVVSDHENNGFDHDPFSPKGVTGLGVWATRNGYVPWVGDWTTLRDLPDVLFITNPNMAITNAYVNRLKAVMDAGGTVVVSGGGDSRTFCDISSRFGAEVVGPPLGRLKGDGFTTYSAWQLRSDVGDHISAGGVTVGAVQRHGKGRLVLIADDGFFYSTNIETETTYDLDNQQFLRRLVAIR